MWDLRDRFRPLFCRTSQNWIYVSNVHSEYNYGRQITDNVMSRQETYTSLSLLSLYGSHANGTPVGVDFIGGSRHPMWYVCKFYYPCLCVSVMSWSRTICNINMKYVYVIR